MAAGSRGCRVVARRHEILSTDSVTTSGGAALARDMSTCSRREVAVAATHDAHLCLQPEDEHAIVGHARGP